MGVSFQGCGIEGAAVVIHDMASVPDTRLKQRAVNEFLVAEKKTVGNVQNCLCAVYGSSAIERSIVGCWV